MMGSCDRHTAFTLAETVISMAVVSVMLVASLTTLSRARLGQQAASWKNEGQRLAQSLMAEIRNQAYAEPSLPVGNAGAMGLGSGEATGTRSAFDDVDDYRGWTSQPPTDPNGTPLPGLGAWARSVSVDWVDPANPASVATSETFVKRVTVVATRHGTPMARVVGLCSETR